MPLFTASLNSGSSGNCYYVANESEAVLIDAGISCREIEKRMENLEHSPAPEPTAPPSLNVDHQAVDALVKAVEAQR